MLRFKLQKNKLWIYSEQFPSYFYKKSQHNSSKILFFFPINNEIALLGGMFQVAIWDYIFFFEINLLMI